jgi:glycosyltransferase involved in cell wall biosynthesis
MSFRILFIVFNRTGEGTYWRAFHFGRVLSKRGYQVDLLVNSPHSRVRISSFEREGVRIIETPDLFPKLYLSGWDGWNIFQRLVATSGERYDIVHAFESRPGVLLPALAKKRSGAALFMDWADWFGRGGSVEERSNPVIRTLLRPPETFFETRFRHLPVGTTVINQVLYDRVIDMGVDPKSVRLLRNGCDVRLQPETKKAARSELGLAEDQFLIGYVGRAFMSDARFMAQAFNHLAANYPNSKLMIIGNFNRPILNWIDEPESVLGSGRVTSETLYTYLSACDICWLPLLDSNANRGRLPMKLNDYMTAGRPIISTGVGDLKKMIQGFNMGKIAPQDPLEFANTTIEVLGNPQDSIKLGQNARRAAETDLNWETLASALMDHYKTCPHPR